jgi:hypothetical protein
MSKLKVVSRKRRTVARGAVSSAPIEADVTAIERALSSHTFDRMPALLAAELGDSGGESQKDFAGDVFLKLGSIMETRRGTRQAIRRILGNEVDPADFKGQSEWRKDVEASLTAAFTYGVAFGAIGVREAKEGPEPREWNAAQALEVLNIRRVPFNPPADVCWKDWKGYSVDRDVAVRDGIYDPLKTMLHEIAHVVLGHTKRTGAARAQHVEEVEAESVAMACFKALRRPGELLARIYIDGWRCAGDVPKDSAQRVKWAARVILSAGCGGATCAAS